MVITLVAFLCFSDYVTDVLEHSVTLKMEIHWPSVHSLFVNSISPYPAQQPILV